MILSASRRTDIPTYYSDWFMNRLKEEYALTRNPMNRSQISKIILSPETIDCIVFWTKDAANILDKLPQMDKMGYSYYFQFTLTPYGEDIERNLRDKPDIVKTFQQLSKSIGRDRVLWRYDPILLNASLTLNYHVEQFETLCNQLCNYTNICTISFVDLYVRLNKAVKYNLLREITKAEMLQLAEKLFEIGRKYGIELRACSEKLDLSGVGIHSASCIDKSIVEHICGHIIAAKPDRNQRPSCGCIQSVDIGVYNTCKNGCIYCYANHSDISIDENYSKHNPGSELLIGTVGADDKITLIR